MTPAMHLSVIKAKYSNFEDAQTIFHDLEQAFSLGHEFGIERAASVVDQCNKKSPYNAIGAASLIRALVVAEVSSVRTIDEDFV